MSTARSGAQTAHSAGRAAAEKTEPEDGTAQDNAPDPDPAELDRKERELALREREATLAEREQALAAREAAPAPAPDTSGPAPLPEYRLTLSSGEVVESPTAGATHHYGSDELLHRVIAVEEMPDVYGVPAEVRRRRQDDADRAAERAAERAAAGR